MDVTVTSGLFLGIITKILVDIIRVFVYKIDGRWVHGTVVVVSCVVAVLTTLIDLHVLSGSIVNDIVVILTSILTAIGANEVTRGRGKLG